MTDAVADVTLVDVHDRDDRRHHGAVVVDVEIVNVSTDCRDDCCVVHAARVTVVDTDRTRIAVVVARTAVLRCVRLLVADRTAVQNVVAAAAETDTFVVSAERKRRTAPRMPTAWK